ncbi:prepilin-type N-terminal cleavage/methylation domain-containing protein [Thiomicrorhabdus arctica]|uniref:prepilin-type N-terminal cleavage/methylation domain-containing protein n=1 Tax=Thiomicrorhabdus arctica TaxID=131540 RepID=UPI0012FE72E5|nr:prepilin-type N-terminal cleavage/methylation domain-containing protein [Thiomicrorhabdus arctica]
MYSNLFKQLSRRRLSEGGFTLIEVMVVVVIISIVLSVGMLSLSQNEESQLRTQTIKVKSFLKFVSDLSAFEQKMYLVVPEKTGLTVFRSDKGIWESSTKVSAMSWLVEAEWQVEPSAVRRYELPKPGWVFWPSGEVTPGSITLMTLSQKLKQQEVIEPQVIQWNVFLQFEGKDL